MHASEAKLQAILNSPNRYIIPVFQRFYSWQSDNWEQLWEDILEVMAITKKKPLASHFMGALVFVPEPLLPDRAPTFQIIDGQQRMMTISILLCALRNVAASYEFNELAKEVNDTFLVHPFKKEVEWYRVYPRHQDRDDYEKAVKGDTKLGNRVGAALSFFTIKILETPELSTEDGLRDFFQLLGGRLEFVHITLGHENPYRIFKSLNSTGVDLSEGDLIRNFVFMHVLTEQQEEFDNKYWKPLEKHFFDKDENVDGKLISAFFRDFLMRDGQYVPPAETYQTFEEKYSTENFDPFSLAITLQDSAKIYDVIRGEKSHPNKKVDAALIKLRELDSSTTYPLILKLMQLGLAEADLAKTIEWLAGFILRRFICQESSRAYGRWFVSACGKLIETPVDALRMFLISKGFPSDNRFKEQFVTYNLYGRRYTWPIMARLERSYHHKEPADLSETQIEHIMPQTLNNVWKRELGSKAKDIHEKWLHTVGNLTLSGYNPELSNKAFTEKKKEYANSNITLTKQIVEFVQWKEQDIENRAQKLAEKAAAIWKAPKMVVPSSVDQEIFPDEEQIMNLRDMLTRIRIPNGQLDLYRILYEAQDDGLSWTEISAKMGRSKAQMAGVLGALGVRINNTEGLDDNQGISHIIEIWQVEQEWHYRIKPAMRRALELEGALDN